MNLKKTLNFFLSRHAVIVLFPAALLNGCAEVDEMLRFNFVQGRLNSKGNYGQ